MQLAVATSSCQVCFLQLCCANSADIFSIADPFQNTLEGSEESKQE